jgi:hypothetical protein
MWNTWNHGCTVSVGLRILSVPLDLRILSAPLDLWILSVPGEKKIIYRGMCVFASCMVLWFVLESHGTLVAVSAPLVMPLHDSDIPMNVPFTFLNQQTITSRNYR